MFHQLRGEHDIKRGTLERELHGIANHVWKSPVFDLGPIQANICIDSFPEDRLIKACSTPYIQHHSARIGFYLAHHRLDINDSDIAGKKPAVIQKLFQTDHHVVICALASFFQVPKYKKSKTNASITAPEIKLNKTAEK